MRCLKHPRETKLLTGSTAHRLPWASSVHFWSEAHGSTRLWRHWETSATGARFPSPFIPSVVSSSTRSHSSPSLSTTPHLPPLSSHRWSMVAARWQAAIALMRGASPSSVSPAVHGSRASPSSSRRQSLRSRGLLWVLVFVCLDAARGCGGRWFTFVCSASPFLLPLHHLFFSSPSPRSKQGEILAFLLVVQSEDVVVLVLFLFLLDLGRKADHWGKCGI
jgi:hypothetical protein